MDSSVPVCAKCAHVNNVTSSGSVVRDTSMWVCGHPRHRTDPISGVHRPSTVACHEQNGCGQCHLFESVEQTKAGGR